MQNRQKKTVAVVGLGSMGLGMATSLVRAGHRVFGADINPAQVDRLVAAGGESAPVAEAAPQCDILVCVVLNAEQTREVLFGAEGWAAHLPEGAVIISSATVAPAFAREMAEAAAKLSLAYLDAPISGGAARAAEGRLSVMASGSREAFDKAAPALQAMAEVVHELGDEPGAGSAMKAVNQLLAGVHIAAMGEALAFAASQGLDLADVVRVISQSAGTSWMFENRAPHVLDNDYAPRSSINIWPKDLGIVAGIAEAAGLPVPLTETALAQYRKAVEAGLGQQDDAAITRVYASAAGLKLPGEA